MAAKGDIKFRFGLRGGKIICISDLQQGENGLNCNCICPLCGERLEARLGNRNQHHFAHYNTECDIESAQQTALHMLAKEIIAENNEIQVPGFDIRYEDVFPDQERNVQVALSLEKDELAHRKSCRCQYDIVEIEKQVCDFIPDLKVAIHNKPCLIEIAVKHFVDEDKKEKIKRCGILTMEIDMSSFYDADMDREEIEKAVLYKEENRIWIFNGKREGNIEELKRKYEPELEKIEQEKTERFRRSHEEAQKKIQKRKETERNITEVFQANKYKRRLIELRNDDMARKAVNECAFREKLKGALPFFLDIPITGEMIFRCDRRAWQSRIFDKFIYNSIEERADIRVRDIREWIWHSRNEIPVDMRLYGKGSVMLNQQLRCVDLVNDVIKRYLLYMYKLGFISKPACGNAVVESWHTMTAPNSENAKRLCETLRVIDRYDLDVDSSIENAMMRE